MIFSLPRKAGLLAAMSALVLSACTVEMILGAEPPTASEAADMAPHLASADAVRVYFSDSTQKIFDPFHGTQIEYFAPNGRAYLWYPGNRRAVPSFWQVREPRENRIELCFLYSPRSFNPVTREFGGNWECKPAMTAVHISDEAYPGDPLDLESGRLPYVMPEDTNVPIAEAFRKSGRAGRLGRNMVTWDWRN